VELLCNVTSTSGAPPACAFRPKSAKYYSGSTCTWTQYQYCTAVCAYKEHKKSMFCLVKGDKPSHARVQRRKGGEGASPFRDQQRIFFYTPRCSFFSSWVHSFTHHDAQTLKWNTSKCQKKFDSPIVDVDRSKGYSQIAIRYRCAVQFCMGGWWLWVTVPGYFIGGAGW
jgi:hypothetical protein